MKIVVYHNPACGTSRNVLALLAERGIEPTVIEYLKTPLDRKGLNDLLGQLKIGARALLRDKGELYEKLKLADPKWTDDERIGFMAEYPVLMNRPVVVTKKGARLCRPAETVLKLLD